MKRDWPEYALAAILAVSVSVSFIQRPWLHPSLAQTALFLLAAVWAIALIVRPFPLRLTFPAIPLAGAVAWGLLQLASNATADRAATRADVLVWAGNLVVFCLAAQTRRRFLDGLLSFAFALSVVSVILYFSGGDPPMLGPFVNRDQFAAFIELTLPLALLRAFSDEGSTGYAVVSAAMYASVIAGASRAGALLATVELIVVPLLLWRRRRPAISARPTTGLGVWILAGVFVAVVGWAVLWHRFQDPDPYGGRREILAGTLAMVQVRPCSGFGLGSFRSTYPAYALRDFGSVVQHAHNDWAEWAADGGVAFGLLLLSILLWSLPRALRSVWGIGIVAVFVHATVDFPLHKPVLELWLFALLGVLASADPN